MNHIPALVRIVLVLGVVVGAMKLRVWIGLALAIGAVALGILFPMDPVVWLRAAGQGLVAPTTIFLLFMIIGILVVSQVMADSGQTRLMIDRFRELVGHSRLQLVVFPALIGLLPMPGGAVFSAPMVGEVSRDADLDPARKTMINYWFRHIWEYWYPIYPGVIMAIALTGLAPARHIVFLFPMTLVVLLVGYAALLRDVDLGGAGRRLRLTPRRVGNFLIAMGPILIIVVAVLALGPLVSRIGGEAAQRSVLVRNSPILVGMVLSLVWVLAATRTSVRVIWPVLWQKRMANMAVMALGLMAFKAVLEASGAVEVFRDEMVAHHIPMIVLVIAIPFVAGVVVGIAIGFVGVSFPVVLSLLAASGIEGSDRIPYIVLAYSSGFAGMMCSPVHLCLLLTNEHFESRLSHVYRWLAPMSGIAMLAAGGLFALYKWMLN